MTFPVRPASAVDAAALCGLFERSGCACYCRWWSFAGDKNAWLDRLAHAADDNRLELEQALRTGDPSARGLVAFDGTSDGASAIGWMRIAPVATLSKVYDQRLYRRLPCFEGERTGVWTVACFLIDPAYRRRGVAGSLLDAGIAHCKSSHARALEAFPRPDEGRGAETLFTGPGRLFEERGFRIVHETGPYSVVRLDLEQAESHSNGTTP